MNQKDYFVDFERLFARDEEAALRMYILEHSNLPGPAANLTMSYAFADYYQKIEISDFEWTLLIEWQGMDSDENEPKIVLPFCAVQAMGAQLPHLNEERQDVVLSLLRKAMNDTRWRMREAVAMAYQRLGEVDAYHMIHVFKDIYPTSTLYEKRAMIASLAHPPLMKNLDVLRYSIQISQFILEDILAIPIEQRKAEAYQALVKGMSYALSVFTAYLPSEGFALMEKYITYDHKDIKKIIKENLKKSRIAKKYPNEVKRLQEKL